MKVVITGGHITPALAVASQLSKEGAEIHFIGRRFANSSEDNVTFEFKEVTSRNIPFFDLKAGRLRREMSVRMVSELITFLKSLKQCYVYLKKSKPDVILSFGGYLAVPVALVAYILRISVVTHEQTINPGVGNRLIGFVAKKVCVSFTETTKVFGKKAILTGNPLRPELFEQTDRSLFDISAKPCLLVTGGSLGAHMINVHIENILPQLIESFVVVHQIGNIKEFNDADRLLKKGYRDYYPMTHISSREIGWIFRNCDVIVSRAGANTVFEIISFNIPAILIPLPQSAGNEQVKHAQMLRMAGVAEVFDQDDDSSNLLELIKHVYLHREIHRRNFDKLEEHTITDAAERIVKILHSCVQD